MDKIKKIFLYLLLFSFGIAIVFAADNFFRNGENWDANVNPASESANDVWNFSGRLDLEDSRSDSYINNGYRGKLTGWVESQLFGTYKTNSELILTLKGKYNDSTYTDEIKNKCLSGSTWTSGPEPEIYTISGSIISFSNLTTGGAGENLWGDLYTSGALSDSYFCSNKKMFLHLFSDTLGDKKVGSGVYTTGNDDFGKQEIYIQGIANINGDSDEGILSRGDQNINAVKVYIGNKAEIKGDINKNISLIYKTYINANGNKAGGDSIKNFINNSNSEYHYVYDYSGQEETIQFKLSNYINKGKKLVIDETNSDNITNVVGINTVIVNGGNIYIKSDIKNTNDKKDLLILIAKKDKNNKNNGGNIYIDPEVTNIDAVLIADGSLISLSGDNIQHVKDNNQVNNLRKQLLIYGKVLSANNVGTDKIPFGADLYEADLDNNGILDYPNNEMDGNIYDLGNLRSFNLNYGNSGTSCTDVNKLAPIDGNGNYVTYGWAGRKECYNDDSTNNGLRGSEKLNPLIIENNLNIDFLNPFILKD